MRKWSRGRERSCLRNRANDKSCLQRLALDLIDPFSMRTHLKTISVPSDNKYTKGYQMRFAELGDEQMELIKSHILPHPIVGRKRADDRKQKTAFSVF